MGHAAEDRLDNKSSESDGSHLRLDRDFRRLSIGNDVASPQPSFTFTELQCDG